MSCAGGQAFPRPHCCASSALRVVVFFTAGSSKNEISKTSVSFWLWLSIPRAYRLFGTEQPVPAPRARLIRGITPSLLFKKYFAVDQVLKAGKWHKHTSFTRRYLRDVAHRSLDAFHLSLVVAAQVPGYPGLLTWTYHS